MTYVIGQPCVDVMDRACVDECPVDCIYEGARSLYIHPDECIDCGACEPVCPVEAIYYEDDLPGHLAGYLADNGQFFAVTLDGGLRRWGRLAALPGSARSGRTPRWWRPCPRMVHERRGTAGPGGSRGYRGGPA